ncbi:TetR/AcrR family transcriptional regulator [Campylobacter sp. MIT 97-5078]|uniref:TetR/AcrR family transcriptional regulator n=1 Tax=Campylobacter sp. MIT 97-5078 TaxID=1548153 RepID=UPI0005141D04|nr:TetR/AcrR family transcriptional regulator [Campylobacter sp. MIT 97-5078]KGI55620.1 hypothetical protein LR59_11235 [Campylobacter sp. MIT 97-5078]KGI57579.1 hypothetical protein LR59_02500 [Campylobacter sp. MIT 97-5078]KGI57664.1 hypothetical protein LR59_02985 [Campylobacter sp. MIT 97-5078]KGI57724.1 hypothetical protein LR59_03315 [Campylobacter sp. MIT 97-5078]TQR26606.1 TetR/AcrR family transcriptional regulator [Campylobacter sp. MIT 97-5078]
MARKLTQRAIARQNKIKTVALECFLEKGYEDTSLNEIIKKSGGSFSSIYTYFESKEGLLLEVLSDEIRRHFNFFKNLENDAATDLRNFLLHFSQIFLKKFNDCTTVALARIIYSQIYNLQGMMKEWFKVNQDFFADTILIKRFKREKNPYLKENAEQLSKLLCTLIKAPFESCVFSNTTMNEQEQQKHIEFCVDFFLKKLV